MSERLTPEELTQIVLEIEKMRSRTENELTREQVKEILQELNLSPEFLDDALMQLRRKQALREQQKRHRAIAIRIAASCLIVIGLAIFFRQQHNKAIALVQAQADRLTLERDNGGNLQSSVVESSRTRSISSTV